MSKYNLEFAGNQSIAKSLTDGIVDNKYFLWVPEWLQDSEEKEYLVLLNTGVGINMKFEIIYQFTAEYIRDKSTFAISKDGKTVVVGYYAKKGVICYDCETGKEVWRNPKVKKIDKIRFNNFDTDIIEVINDKLEFIYLDKCTGQILNVDKTKGLRQVINWMRISENGKFLMVADYLSSKCKANYTVYDTESNAVKGRFIGQSHMSEKTFHVSNDGELAVCAAYNKQGVSLIRVTTGEILWTQKQPKEIVSVSIDNVHRQVIVCCSYGGMYFLNIDDGEIYNHKSIKKIYKNPYGVDIELIDDKTVRIDKYSIECPTFSWLDVIGIKEGIVLQPAGNQSIMLYDYEGNMVWENDKITGKIGYQEDNNLICVFANEDHTGRITLISAMDGKIISVKDIPECACAYMYNNKAVICNTGKMYDVSNGCIKEIDATFELVVGESL